jgi:tetratricopeptide (TPR) repeat protein
MLGSEAVRTLEHDWRLLTRSVEKAFRDGQLSKAEDICWEGLSKAKLIGEFEPRLAISLSNLAVIQRLRGQRDRAEDLSNIALRIFQAVDRRSPLMAKGLLNAASFFHDEGRWGEARRLYGKAITLLEEGTRDELLCQALVLYARLCSDQNRGSQAETLLKRVASLDPQTAGGRMLFLMTSAQVAMRQDRLTRSEQMLDECRQILADGVELESVWMSSMLALRGDLEAAMYTASREVSGSSAGDFAKRTSAVIHAFQQALDIREGIFGPYHASCGQIHRRLAAFYLEIGSYDIAEQLLRKALTIALSARGPYHWETLKCLESSQEMLRLAGRHSEASDMETRVNQVEKKVRERARETYVVWGEPDDHEGHR